MVNATHGRKADVIGAGLYLSQFLNSAAFNGTKDMADITVFQQDSKNFIPGLGDPKMNCEGFWDGTIGAVDDVFTQLMASATPAYVTYAPAGLATFGNVSYTIAAFQGNYEIKSDLSDANKITAEFQGNSLDFAYAVHPLQAEVAGGNTGDLTVASSTANGAVLIVHATVVATNMTVKLQDSADGTTWADLTGTTLSFTAPTVGSQRISNTGTVRTHLRALWTGTGTFAILAGRK